jgi:hypothetical protein
VAGIHLDIEIVHKSVIALTGNAVPASAFPRFFVESFQLHPTAAAIIRTRTL